MKKKDYYIAVNITTAFLSALCGIVGLLFSLWLFLKYKRIPSELIFLSFLLLGAFFLCFINIKVEKRKLRGLQGSEKGADVEFKHPNP
jgi:hypothetical protein